MNLALLESVKDGIVDRETLTEYMYTMLLEKQSQSEQLRNALHSITDPLPVGSPLKDVLINRCAMDKITYGPEIPDLHGYQYKLLRMFREGFFGPICLEPDVRLQGNFILDLLYHIIIFHYNLLYHIIIFYII